MRQIFTESVAPSFAVVDTDGQVSQLKQTAGSFTVGANRQIIAAVTGKRLRVMGLVITGGAAATYVNIKDGSGGASCMWVYAAAGVTVILPIDKLGWIDTSAGVGLFVDVATADVTISVRYVEFTQSA